MSWIRRLAATFRPQHLDQALDGELDFHIEQRALDLMAQGTPPEEARRQAALLFGNRGQLRECTRDRDVVVWLAGALQDLRFAARTLRRNPGFALAAVLSLALGIGANTALFSLIDTLVLRSLPVARPAEIVRILGNGEDTFSYPPFDLLRSGTRLLNGVAAVSRIFGPSSIDERGEPAKAIVQAVSGNYFDLLGVPAWRGRAFHAADARLPEGAIAVISEAYWQQHYNGAAGTLGAHFRYANRDFTVTGSAPPGFRGTNVDAPADIWVPLEQAMPPGSPMWTRGRWLQLLARLGPGVTHAQAEAEATALTGRKITLQPGGTGFSRLRERFSRPVIVLECVVALVLLIACANLANLTLAGAASRHSEFALRKAIGAGRGRLVRQLLTENLLVSALGAMLALAVAGWMSAAMLRFLPPEAAPALANLRFHLNGPVLAFTASVSLATCLLLGLAPAIRATSHSLAAGMKREGNWANRGLIVAEVAMCTLLLIGAALFVESLRNLRALPTGYSDVEHIVTADVEMPRTYSAADRRQRMEDLRQRAAALPGVQVAATSHIRPLSGFSISDGIPINGEIQNIDVQHVSPGFLAAMGTPLITGRDFSERDDTRAPQVAIVNESFVRQFLADGNPLGAHFGLEIVGVVRDTRWINLKDKPPAMYYRPLAQWDGTAMTLVVRATGDFATVSAGLGRAAHDVDPKIALRDVVPFREMEDRILVIERMLAQGATAFGALALLVACIGLYGVLAYGVARRTREIGVRMALGASRGGVQWMVLRESLALLAVGFAIGVPAALALTRYSAAMLFGITAHDPRAMVSALGILLAVALAAAAIPARRAASVDPLTALRYE